MVNYGIDPDRYKRDLHQILWHTYSGLAETLALSPYSGLRDRLNGFIRLGYYRLKTAVHRHLFRKYSLLSAHAYGAETAAAAGANALGELRLDALIQYYNAFEAYPRRAGIYLGMARDFEAPLIPQAANSYDAEEGTLLKDRKLLRQSIDAFDPIWERDTIADTYAELALLAKGYSPGPSGRNERQDAAERLYALNRGALRQKGIKLPVDLLFDPFGMDNGAAEARRIERTLRRLLPKAGIRPAPLNESAAALPSRFRLTVTIASAELRCELYDAGRGTSVWRRSIPLPSLSAKDLSAAVRSLADTAFTVK
jgi:hypothetical protein